MVVVCPLSVGAVTQGNIIVDGSSKVVEHLEGGILKAIHVRNGDSIAAGDLILELDSAAAEAKLKQNEIGFFAAQARINRLHAERTGLDEPEYSRPETLLISPDEAEHIRELDLEQFRARKEIHANRIATFESLALSAGTHVTNLREQIAATGRQIDMIQEEVDASSELLESGYTPKSRVLALRRASEALTIDRLDLQTELARARSASRSAQSDLANAMAEWQAGLDQAIVDTEIELAQISSERSAAFGVWERAHVRAPVDGVLMNLEVTTIGEVIDAGARIASIVEGAESLKIRGRLAPQDVANIQPGLPARITVLAFSSRSVGQLDGRVSYVSPDTQQDAPNQASYYQVEIDIDPSSLEDLGGYQLVAGMPVQAVIETDTRPMVSYLLDPLVNSFRRAFNED